MIVVLAGPGLGSAAAAAEPGPLPLPWRYLRWEARSGVLRARAEAWLAPAAPAAPGQPAVAVLRLRWDAPFGAPSDESSWLVAADGRLIRSEWRRKDRWRVRSVAPGTLVDVIARPAGAAERRAAPEHWTDRSETSITLPEGSLVPTDSLGILYLACLAAGPGVRDSGTVRKLDTTGGAMACLAVSRGEPVRIELVDLGPTDAVLPDGAADASPRGGRRGAAVPARRVGVRAESLTDGERRPKLLGLDEGIEIVVATDTGLPVLITGRARRIGQVRARLVEATRDEGAATTSRRAGAPPR